MKPISNTHRALALRSYLLSASLLLAPCVHAATIYWDGTDSTGNADGGAGTWNLINSNWDSAASSGTNQIWSNVTPDIATFGGTAGTVTLGSTIFAGGLTFNHSTGTYTIAGGTSSNVLSTGAVTLATTAGGTTSITATMFQTGTLTITNAGNLSIDSIILGGASTLSASTSNLTIGSVTVPGQIVTLAGAGGGEITGIMSLNAGGVTKTGVGTWTLSNSKNLWTGTTSVSNGTLKLGASNTLGFGTSTLNIANPTAILDLNGKNVTVGGITHTTTGGSITNTASSTTSTLTFGSGSTTSSTYSSQIQDGSGTVALIKVGSGTQIFSGSVTNAFSGGINVNGGIFTLDFANMATPTNLVGSTNTLGLGGGSFRITGKASNTSSQTLGNVTLNAGGGQILATNNSALNIINLTLGSLTTSAAGGSLLVGTTATDATGLTITTTTNKDATGIYGGRVVFFNGTASTGYDWATTASGSSPYALSAYSGYATAWSTTASANVGATSDTSNSLINNSGGSTIATTLTGAVTTNTLKIANTATAGTQSLAIAGQSLTLTGGGLLVTGTRAYTISGTAGATRLTAGDGLGGAADLVIHQFNSGTSPGLTISAVIGDNTAGSGNAVNLVKAGGNNLTLSGNNTYTGRTYLNINSGTTTISGSSTTSGTTMASGSTLSLGNASGLGTGDLTMNGGTFNNGTGSILTLNNALNISGDVSFNSSALNDITQQTGAVTLTGNNLITVSNNTLTLNGNIGGMGGFFKQGSGTLTLGGASNTYSGPTLISAGVLNINTAITSDQLTILGGTVNLGASNVLASNTSIAVDGTGATLNLGGFNQTIGTLTMGSGSGTGKGLVSGSGSSTLTLTGGIVTSNHNSGDGGNITVTTLDLNNATQNFLLGGSGGGTDDLSISSVVQNGGINIVGTISTTAVTLSNANTYSGATSINLATLRLGHLNALQNSALDTMGTGTVTLAAGAGSYTLGGLTGSKALASVITGTPTNLTTLVLNPGNAATYSYSGAIADLSTGMVVTKSGAGTQILTGTNGYTGGTNLAAGTLSFANGSLGSSGNITFTGSSTLQWETGNTQDVSSRIVMTNGVTSTFHTNGNNVTFASAIGSSSTGALTKTGSGKLTLSANNTYTGTTTVSQGTLAISGTGSIGSSSLVKINSTLDVTAVSGNYTVGAAQTYGGSGTVLATGKTVVMNGTLSPGNSPGTLTQDGGTLQLGANSNMNWQVYDANGIAGTGYDSVSLINGATLDLSSLSVGNEYNINLWSLSAIGPDVNGNATNFNNALNYAWTLFSTGTAITGFNSNLFKIFTAANNGTNGFTNTLNGTFGVSLADGGTDIVVTYTAVPEPGSALLGGIGVLLLLRRRR